jgi:predicted dinucleotide-binding enzyme
VANILFLLSNDQYIDQRSVAEIIPKLAEESRMILAFMRNLKSLHSD